MPYGEGNNKTLANGDHAMIRKILLTIFVAVSATIGCTSIPQGLAPVTGFHPDRYLGKWYEIARLDHQFERNLTDVNATYTRSESDIIQVRNRGFDAKGGKWKEVQGRARFLISEDFGSLKVSFFGPFYGGYHIIALDQINYQYAMVAGPSRSYLWILARQKKLDERIYEELLSKASTWGFDITQLIRVEHNLSVE